jgi:hydrogenase expression/formation protein HypC
MCLGVPGEIVDRESPDVELAHGLVEFAGIRRRVCLACVPEARVGDYVIVHAGVAISTLDAVEARRLFEYLLEFAPDESREQEEGANEVRR